VVRRTIGGNGTTFDLQGRLINCEGHGHMVTRLAADGSVTTLVDRFGGKKLNRPNDVICHSNGSLFFTDPSYRVPVHERELDAAVYRVAPDGAVSLAVPVEYPNGLALSPMSGRSTSQTRGGASTSMRWSWMRPAIWCGGGCSPTCRPTAPTACRTA
jgi:sugar lactone lactonase YvrE